MLVSVTGKLLSMFGTTRECESTFQWQILQNLTTD